MKKACLDEYTVCDGPCAKLSILVTKLILFSIFVGRLTNSLLQTALVDRQAVRGGRTRTPRWDSGSVPCPICRLFVLFDFGFGI